MITYRLYNKNGQLIHSKEYYTDQTPCFLNFIAEVLADGLRLKDLDLERSIKRTNHENNTQVKSILAVDDDLVIRNMFHFFAQKTGHYITTVSSAEEALKLIQAKPYLFQYVFLDKHLPGQDGDDFGLKLKSFNKETKIYVVTGDPQSVINNIQERGIEAVIEKPFDLQKFINIVGCAWDKNKYKKVA
jgi:CheY-like chemotaxis protein